jgi:hypothetical protein
VSYRLPANLLSRNPSNISLLAVGLLVMIFGSILSAVPIRAQTTYSVTINSVCNLGANDISFNTIAVPILQDGISTGYVTPHTFTGLIGVHNFTVPYQDTSGHIFRDWQANLTRQYFTTAYVSTDTIFWVDYGSDQFNVSSFTWNQYRFFITPSDPAVIAASANMSYLEIINWVSSNITYDTSLANGDRFPNETLALHKGVCRDFAHLCVSMLISRGYRAYVVAGNLSGVADAPLDGPANHAWAVVEVGGILYHFEPDVPLLWLYNASVWDSRHSAWAFYDNQVFIPAAPSADSWAMPWPTPTSALGTPTPAPTIIPTPLPAPTPTATPTASGIPTATNTPTIAPSPTPTPTSIPISTNTPTTTPPQTPMTTPTPQATTEPMATPQTTIEPTEAEPTIQPTTNNGPNTETTDRILIVAAATPIIAIVAALAYKKRAPQCR